GKSKILQTYILAMSTLFHPYEVSFVIIDFKGGGMVNQFKQLPHLLGAITNIDGKEINRSLKSIKAELQKRQRLFAEADVNHIDKYIRKYKAGEVNEPLPHLIIIVDEFAELKAEQPEFMKELISAARIGRSLGVHLILATQKPSGQVNEQIWSNSRFKLCLKVQSQEDSNEVIKSPLAAEIKEPGRAYLQVGNNEIFELFQSAYSGASEKADDSNVKEFKIFSLTDSGKRIPVYVQKKQKSGEGSVTQLDAIVKYVSDYCDNIHLPKLPDICLPALGEVINFPDNSLLLPKSNSIQVELGVYDDPDNQYQGVYHVDLTNENLMIIGSSQSGKTNILQNIIRSISTKYTPDEVNIYIIDFASMV
ncbi:MAG: FtsK/SpoIIIE domain-containing protein, partial [Oscillospiraceae bacterium]